MGKYYEAFEGEDKRGTFTQFDEATSFVVNFDRPAIVCYEDGKLTWGVALADGRWVQSYETGKERDVTDRMKSMQERSVKKYKFRHGGARNAQADDGNRGRGR